MAPQNQKSRKVAVIAVHGVARHEPGETARAMTTLLQTLPNSISPDSSGRYREFSSEPIQIPLHRVKTGGGDAPSGGSKIMRKVLGLMAEPSKRLAADLERVESEEGASSVSPASTANRYMRELLKDYQGSEATTFATERLVGQRENSKSEKATVHIYEAYWADLARPNNSFLSFVTATFQLLLHIGDLATLSLDSGAGENNNIRWRMLRTFQTYAVRLLQIPIPILNAILLVGALSVTIKLIPDEASIVVFTAVAGILGVGVGYSSAQRVSTPKSAFVWLLLPVLWAIAGSVGGAVLLHFCPTGASTLLLVEWWLLGAIAFSFVIKAYSSVRPGTLEIGWLLYGAAFVLFLFLYYEAAAKGGDVVPHAILWFMQWILASLRLFWGALFVFAFLAFFTGLSAWQKARSPDARARAQAAIRTSALGLTMPSLLFFLLALFIWGGIFRWAIDPTGLNLKAFNQVTLDLAPGHDLAPWLFVDPSKVDSILQGSHLRPHEAAANKYFEAAFVWSAGPGLAVTCLALVVTVIGLVIGILPSITSEGYVPNGGNGPPRTSTNQLSEHMGSWLTRFLDSTRFMVPFLWLGFFPVIWIFDWWYFANADHPLLLVLNTITYSIIMWISGIVASLAVLGLLIRTSSSALGIILDVDTYLRAAPVTATPRARIAERYVSVLRHVANFKDVDGQGYDSVVIVAHSLGSLISADLLMFLKRSSCDDELSRLGFGSEAPPVTIPIYLFTMGNPLRQLLNRFFPYLYGWVRDEPDGGLRPTPNNSGSQPVMPGSAPHPGSLGVIQWVNAYRSGDYVGRALWLDGWYRRSSSGEGATSEKPYIASLIEGDGIIRQELCIGAGAHQRYWDDSAPDVANILDELIAKTGGPSAASRPVRKRRATTESAR